MNVLDENIAKEESDYLKSWGIPVRHIGYDLGRQGIKDEEIIPLLHRLRQPTYFTRDGDFYTRDLCHQYYCLVYLAVGPDQVATFARRFLRHPQFNTQAKRMGAVVRISHIGLAVWRLHAEQEAKFSWVIH